MFLQKYAEILQCSTTYVNDSLEQLKYAMNRTDGSAYVGQWKAHRPNSCDVTDLTAVDILCCQDSLKPAQHWLRHVCYNISRIFFLIIPQYCRSISTFISWSQLHWESISKPISMLLLFGS